MIRHRLDFAAVLLLDERFTPKPAQDQISGWMRPFLRVHGSVGDAMLSLTRFFKAAPMYIQEQIKALPQVRLCACMCECLRINMPVCACMYMYMCICACVNAFLSLA